MDLGLEQSLSKSSHNCLFLVLFGKSEKKNEEQPQRFLSVSTCVLVGLIGYCTYVSETGDMKKVIG